MAQIIDMPKLSDTMTVGTLVKWLKSEGSPVKSGDMLAEVETDKATMELESFFDGVLLKQFAAVGAQVPVGAPLCAIGAPGEKVEAPAAPPTNPAPAPERRRRRRCHRMSPRGSRLRLLRQRRLRNPQTRKRYPMNPPS